MDLIETNFLVVDSELTKKPPMPKTPYEFNNRQSGFFSRAADCMPKTFLSKELPARAQRRIRSPNEAQAESTLVHGEVSLDLLTRRAAAAGIEHDLTAREFTMLEFFFGTPVKLFLESSYSQGFGA